MKLYFELSKMFTEKLRLVKKDKIYCLFLCRNNSWDKPSNIEPPKVLLLSSEIITIDKMNPTRFQHHCDPETKH